MRAILPVALTILSVIGCSHVGQTGRTTSDTGINDTGGGTMNNPTGIEGAAGSAATASSSSSAPAPATGTEVVTPPGTGSAVSTAGPEGGVTGAGVGAASPANAHGTGTGPTTP